MKKDHEYKRITGIKAVNFDSFMSSSQDRDAENAFSMMKRYDTGFVLKGRVLTFGNNNFGQLGVLMKD